MQSPAAPEIQDYSVKNRYNCRRVEDMKLELSLLKNLTRPLHISGYFCFGRIVLSLQEIYYVYKILGQISCIYILV